MIRTYTRTHTEISFANPHLVCDTCGQPVPAWHDPDRCGCDKRRAQNPCGHVAGITSVCPSWEPVDGCQCAEQLATVGHPPAPAGARR